MRVGYAAEPVPAESSRPNMVGAGESAESAESAGCACPHTFETASSFQSAGRRNEYLCGKWAASQSIIIDHTTAATGQPHHALPQGLEVLTGLCHEWYRRFHRS